METNKSYSSIYQYPYVVQWLQQKVGQNQSVDSFFLEQLDSFLTFKLSGKIPDKIDNTYLKEYAVPQIKLFDLLANRFPIVKSAQKLVENSFIHFNRTAQHICIIDLGIGRGLQVIDWLKALNLSLAPLSVTVIGVELTEPALLFTRSQFERIKKELCFSFDFHLLHMPVGLRKNRTV